MILYNVSQARSFAVEQIKTVKNRWNRKIYRVVEVKDRKVTLQRPDGSKFTIDEKEYLYNYVKNNA